jgi:hypothetical protein
MPNTIWRSENSRWRQRCQQGKQDRQANEMAHEPSGVSEGLRRVSSSNSRIRGVPCKHGVAAGYHTGQRSAQCGNRVWRTRKKQLPLVDDREWSAYSSSSVLRSTTEVTQDRSRGVGALQRTRFHVEHGRRDHENRLATHPFNLPAPSSNRRPA